MSLSKLPQLEELELWGFFEGITGKGFKNFTGLKRLTCWAVEDMKKGFFPLMLLCHELNKISLYSCSGDDVLFIILCAVILIGKRENDVPLDIRSDECNVRLVPHKSAKDSSKKVWFEVHDHRWPSNKEKRLPDLTTHNENDFIDRVLLLINNPR